MGSFRLPSRKVPLRLIGVAVAVAVAVLGVTIKVRNTWVGERITECGVDAKGPYAKVRVGSRWGGLGAMDHEGVLVHFTYDGHGYDVGGSTIKVPTFGSTTTFVRGTWPPRVINMAADGGPRGKVTVPGHVAGGYWVTTGMILQSPQEAHPKFRRHFKAFVEPGDKSLLGCEGVVIAPTEE